MQNTSSNRPTCDIEVPDVPLAQFDELEIFDEAQDGCAMYSMKTDGSKSKTKSKKKKSIECVKTPPRNQKTSNKLLMMCDEEKSNSSASNSVISTSLQDLVESFDKNVTGMLKDLGRSTEQIAPVKIRSQEEIMAESQFWWTLTGNYGSLPPIDFDQSVIRRKQLAALDLQLPKSNTGAATPTDPDSLSEVDSEEEDEQQKDQHIDFHAAASLYTNSTGDMLPPPVNADRVIEEIDEIIQAGDLMTQSLINTPRTLESFDSMYSSMRSPNVCPESENDFGGSKQQSSNGVVPISTEEMSRYSQSKLLTIVSEIEQIIQLYNEELVRELAQRDELEYEKEVRNQFITLLTSVQEKRRKALMIGKKQRKRAQLTQAEMAKQKNNLCSVTIPYDNSHEVLDIRVLGSLIKILQAMNDDSEQLASLLTDYILNVICPAKTTFDLQKAPVLNS